MKTIGQQAQEFRLYKRWNSAQMAGAVGTSRQNIESLEAVGDRTPKYMASLARVMGTTVDALMAGEYRVPSQGGPPAAKEPSTGALPSVKSHPGIELGAALEKIAWAIATSPHRGSDALAGMFASLCKEPESALYLEMLDRLLTEKQDAPRKVASKAA